MGPNAIIFIFWMLSFKIAFSLSSFTFVKRLFSSFSWLSAIRVVPSAYLRLLIFLPAILIPACASSSPAFHMMYSAYKLNKQGDNIQLWCPPFLIWNQPIVPRPILTVASWLPYRFLRRQIRWTGIPISFRIFQFVVIHTVKGFGIVNEAKKDVFLELPCFFYNPTDVGNLISCSAAFSKSVLNIWKFLVHIFFLYIILLYFIYFVGYKLFLFFLHFFFSFGFFFLIFLFFLLCNIVLVFPYTHIVEA